ncbi:MAG: hypothetical protein QF489_06310 [Planctomycetota bacterium]|nr:hypothetical protein [Planctomycetota bacterium]
MSPLAELFQACLNPFLVPIVFFLHWWVVWFTLGRNFSTTLYLVILARVLSVGGGYALVASGALGATETQFEGNWLAWIVAMAAAWLWFWRLEAAVLAWGMQRRRKSWQWNPYDLTVLGAAHVVYLIGAAVAL